MATALNNKRLQCQTKCFMPTPPVKSEKIDLDFYRRAPGQVKRDDWGLKRDI